MTTADTTLPVIETPLRNGEAGRLCVQRLVGRHSWALLINADWMDVREQIEAAAIVTDPPYGIQADKAKAHSSIRDNEAWPESKWDESRPAESYLRLLPTLAPMAAIWGGNYMADCLPASSGWLVWRKPQAETGFSLADCELCWTTESFAARMKTMPRRDGNLHPTQKPVIVMAWTMDCLKVPQGATVCDPYMGSGTTGIACIRTGRNFIGIERDAAHYKTACDRIAHELDGALL